MLNKLQLTSLITAVACLPILANIVQKKQSSSINYSIDSSITYPVFQSATSFDDSYSWINNNFSGDALAQDILFNKNEVVFFDVNQDFFGNSLTKCNYKNCDVFSVSVD